MQVIKINKKISAILLLFVLSSVPTTKALHWFFIHHSHHESKTNTIQFDENEADCPFHNLDFYDFNKLILQSYLTKTYFSFLTHVFELNSIILSFNFNCFLYRGPPAYF